MRIYDCFPFFNELDLLDIRFNELYDVVDYFVIIEGERTHQNNPKPLYYLENKERYAQFEDKIIHLVIDESNFKNNPTHNEYISFEVIRHIAEQANDDDILFIGCADEIIKADIIKSLAETYKSPIIVNLHNFCYYLNTQFEENSPVWWAGPLISVKDLKDVHQQIKPYMNIIKNSNMLNSSHVLDTPLPHGWHFTFMGSTNDIKSKINSYIHTEWNHLTEEDIKLSIENLTDPLNRNNNSHKFVGMYPIEKLPIHVQNNLNKYSHLIKK